MEVIRLGIFGSRKRMCSWSGALSLYAAIRSVRQSRKGHGTKLASEFFQVGLVFQVGDAAAELSYLLLLGESENALQLGAEIGLDKL